MIDILEIRKIQAFYHFSLYIILCSYIIYLLKIKYHWRYVRE